MKRHTSIAIAVIMTMLWNCRDDRQFTEARKLSGYEKTEFLISPEQQISKHKNAVYCATLLFAWDELRKITEQPIRVSDDNYELNLLNSSNAHINTLNGDEYNASSKISGDLITVKAEFNKSLPFEMKLHTYEKMLTFDNQFVASFGVTGTDDYELRKTVKILYYKNDNNFIIKLLPKDHQHEIVLFKSEKTFSNIAVMNLEILKLTAIGNTEKNDEKKVWKYYLKVDDVVVIPKFNFNIETNYSALEGQSLSAGSQKLQILRAWQRTAFILDESGAEVESGVSIDAAEEMEEEHEKPRPKKLVFDKPFLILLKRTDATNPYFGLWAANTELMIKE